MSELLAKVMKEKRLYSKNEKGDDGAYANIAMPIKYAHQLQQALRLAGMTDIANNFKV